MNAEAWVALASVIAALATAVFVAIFSLLFKIHGTLATVLAQIKNLVKAHDKDVDEHQRIWETLDEHGNRLTAVEQSRQSNHPEQ